VDASILSGFFRENSNMNPAKQSLKNLYLQNAILLSHILNDYFKKKQFSVKIINLPIKDNFCNQLIIQINEYENTTSTEFDSAIRKVQEAKHIPSILLLTHLLDQVLNASGKLTWNDFLRILSLIRSYAAYAVSIRHTRLLTEIHKHYCYISLSGKLRNFMDIMYSNIETLKENREDPQDPTENGKDTNTEDSEISQYQIELYTLLPRSLESLRPILFEPIPPESPEISNPNVSTVSSNMQIHFDNEREEIIDNIVLNQTRNQLDQNRQPWRFEKALTQFTVAFGIFICILIIVYIVILEWKRLKQ
jgi:hypothetical protein